MLFNDLVMIERAIIYVLVTIIVILGGYGYYSKYKVKSLKEEVIELETENTRLEELLKIKPFEAVNRDRKERANEEINATISNSNSIPDDTYSL